MRHWLVPLLFLLNFAAPASAMTVTYEISGAVTAVVAMSGVQVGDAYTATLTVDYRLQT